MLPLQLEGDAAVGGGGNKGGGAAGGGAHGGMVLYCTWDKFFY